MFQSIVRITGVALVTVALASGIASASPTATSITLPRKCPNPTPYNVAAYANPSDKNPDNIVGMAYRVKPDGSTTTTDAIKVTVTKRASDTLVTMQTRAGGAAVNLICGQIVYIAGVGSPSFYYVYKSITFNKQSDGSYLAKYRIVQTDSQRLVSSFVDLRDTAYPLAP